MRKIAATILALAFLFPTASSAETIFKTFAAPAPDGAPVKGWQPADPDDEPDEGAPGAPERGGFWDRLQDKAFDQICKNIKLSVKQKLDLSEYGGSSIRVQRRLRRTAAGTFAMVDRGWLELNLGFSRSLFTYPDGALSISVGSSLRGESIVVRPTGSKKSCKQLGRLLNITDYKTAIPLSPKRIAAMQVGEIWKLPLTLYVGVGIGAGSSIEEFPAFISFSRGKDSRAAVSLYRMSEDKLRFRLRIDKAEIHGYGGRLQYLIPGAALGLPEVETIIVEQLIKLVNKQTAKFISRYLTSRFGMSRNKRQGRQIMIEYVLDPNDKEQMDAMRSLMHGDLNAFSTLTELLKEASHIFKKKKDAIQEAKELRDRHSGGLGSEATFVGADDYERRNSRWGIKLPVLIDYDNVSGRERDHIVVLDDEGSRYDVYQADQRNETAMLDIPFLGAWTKLNKQRTVQVITTKKEGQETTEPVAVFIRQEGFLRKNSTTARNMMAEADKIMRLVGVKGDGINEELRLPVDEIFPEEEIFIERKVLRSRAGYRRGATRKVAKSYKRGISAFTLVFNRQAVADILTSPSELIYRAYINTLSRKKKWIMNTVMPISKIREDGAMDYSTREARKALGYRSWKENNARQTMNTLSWTAHNAARIVRDLKDAASAPTAELRAERFLAVLAGDGEGGLAYEEILKVLVQLVDPKDIAGEFFVRIDKGRKGEKDIRTRLVLNDNLDDAPIISEASINRARFAEPSVLKD